MEILPNPKTWEWSIRNQSIRRYEEEQTDNKLETDNKTEATKSENLFFNSKNKIQKIVANDLQFEENITKKTASP